MNLAEFIEIAVFAAPVLILAAALAVAAGPIGVFVLLRRQTLAALALPQAVAVGVAVGLRMGWPTLGPAVGAVLLCILLVSMTRTSGHGETLLAASYIGGLALTMLIVAGAAQHLSEVQNRFVGIDVAVTFEQAWIVGPVMVLLGALASVLWRRWTLVTLTPVIGEIAGVRPARWNAAFLALLACVVLLGTDSLGAVMVLGLLLLPGACVLPWVTRIPQTIVTSALTGVIFVLIGFVLSVAQDWPLSQSVAGIGFVSLLISRTLRLRA